jgi:hypothetical protein
VTTSVRSRKEQARDFRLFIGFLQTVIGSEERLDWTPRVSREFVDYLRSQIHEDGSRRFADRTVNRCVGVVCGRGRNPTLSRMRPGLGGA